MYETGGWPRFEGSLSLQKIESNSDTAKYYGGPIKAKIDITASDPDSGEELIDLPDSYKKEGINTPEELISFLSKKLKDGETYIKRYLNKRYKHLF